jgi:hypothetical protein
LNSIFWPYDLCNVHRFYKVGLTYF